MNSTSPQTKYTVGGSSERASFNMEDPHENTSLFHFEDRHSNKRFCKCRRPYLVEPAVFLYSLAVWTFITLNEQYIYDRLGRPYTSLTNDSSVPAYSMTDDVCRHTDNRTDVDEEILKLQTKVKAEASQWELYISLSRLLPCIFTILIICSHGDRVGRKCGLILPCVGGMTRAVVYLFVDYLHLPIGYLIVGNLTEGILGYQLTFMASAYAYISDVVPYENLTMRFAILNSIYLLSCTISGLASGHLIAGLGYSTTFWILAVLFAVSSAYVMFGVPESLPVGSRRKTLSISVMFWSTVNAFRIYTKPREQIGARLQLGLLLIISVFLSIILLGMVDLETMYVLGPPYCFTSVQIGYFIALFSLIGVVAPVVAIPMFQLCVTDDIFGIVSSLSGAAGYLLQGLATNTVQLFLIPFALFLASALVPLTRSMMSKLVSQEEQGSLQASISALNAIGELASIFILIGIYSMTVTTYNGLVFFIVAVFYLIMATLFGAIVYRNRRAAAGSEELLRRLGLFDITN